MRIIMILVLIICSIYSFSYENIDILLTFYNFQKNEKGEIVRVEKIKKETIPAKSEQLLLAFPLGKNVSKIEGLTNLKNLRRLIIGLGVHDYSFLQYLKNLEVLIIDYTEKYIDLEMLKYLPELKVLLLDGITIKNENMDLKINTNLEFIYLGNLRSSNYNGMYELSIINIPKSLNYVDMRISTFIIINSKLLDSLKNVDCIITRDEEFDSIKEIQVSEQYLTMHPNIHIYEYGGKEFVPDKYRKDKIYALFGVDKDHRLLSTGKYTTSLDGSR